MKKKVLIGAVLVALIFVGAVKVNKENKTLTQDVALREQVTEQVKRQPPATPATTVAELAKRYEGAKLTAVQERLVAAGFHPDKFQAVTVKSK